jgi:threonine/homoserine/homoserine lactone efflux protein
LRTKGEEVSVHEALLAYLLASSILTITPGLDTAFVLRTAVVSGRTSAIGASAGICLGLLSWGCAASFGMAALLNASRIGYHLVRIGGGIYLLTLGAQIIFNSSRAPRTFQNASAEQNGKSRDDSPRRCLVQGMLTNLLNPKVGIFYLTFLPSFVPARINVAKFSLLLVAIHIVEGMIWFGVLIAAAASLSRRLRDPKYLRALDSLTGTILLGFGVKALFQQRS